MVEPFKVLSIHSWSWYISRPRGIYQNLYILLSRLLFVASYPFGNSNLIFFLIILLVWVLWLCQSMYRACPMPVETEEGTGSMGLMELHMVVRCCMGAGDLTWVLRNGSQCSKQGNLPFPSQSFLFIAFSSSVQPINT